MDAVSARYAIYYAPDQKSPWWGFGSSWLGRDRARDPSLSRPRVCGLDEEGMDAITAQPRRYGFHATLKAPFRLRQGITVGDLLARLRTFAATRRAVALGPLAPICLDGFVALVPMTEDPRLRELATACVTELDDLRAPPTPAEQDRRRIDPADGRAVELFERYGYPLVLERFRFHMTLTGPVDDALARQIVEQLAPAVARLNAQQPAVLDRLCLFVETPAGAAFSRVADMRLAS